MSKPDPLRRSLEDALAADPDDLAAHMAYADLLTEQGDPRGEFVQVQLGLEDPSCQGEDRRRLQYRKLMLLAHEREWLGELARHLFEPKVPAPGDHQARSNQWHWSRGWLEDLSVWFLDVDFARALSGSPVARLLRRLGVCHTPYPSDMALLPDYALPSGYPFSFLPLLSHARFLDHLRYFRIGQEVDFEEVDYNSSPGPAGLFALVAAMPRLEELEVFARLEDLVELFGLPTLTRLRALTVYHQRDYPLVALAANPALSSLVTLRLHPAHADDGVGHLPAEVVRPLLRAANLPSLRHLHLHGSSMGDQGVEELVRSGLLSRLETLDLRHGCVSYHGARLLARSPDVRHLKYLSLAHNQISSSGVQALRALESPTLTVRLDGQDERGSEAYLYTGDME